jgi:hypothetical protein
MPHDDTSKRISGHGPRLTPADGSKEISPWRRAPELVRCNLYWMPVRTFPIPTDQRTWLMEFSNRLIQCLTTHLGLRAEVFLHIKSSQAIREELLQSARDFAPTIGLGRRPGTGVPTLRSIDELQAIADGLKEVSRNDLVPDYCYWFLNKAHMKQRELFFGHGAVILGLLKPDPNTEPPQLPFSPTFRKKHKIFQMVDVDGVFTRPYALRDSFLAKSKELFGAGIEANPQFRGLLFVLPLLMTADFFSQPAEECEKWFQVFDVYIKESTADHGVLMAAKIDIEKHLVSVIEKMKQEGLEYSAG